MRVIFFTLLFSLSLTQGVYAYPSQEMAAQDDVFLASGTISLDSKLEEKAKGIRTLFVTIFNAESSQPVPYGSQKIDLKKDAKGQFAEFNLTTGNIARMQASAGKTLMKMRIKARLDKDGSAGVDQPGDLIGVIDNIDVGAKNLKLMINQAK